MRIRKHALALVAAAFLGSGAVQAGALEDGVQAFDQGNYARSMTLLESPAQAGDPRAQDYLGRLYEDGLGAIDKDAETAVDWYTRSAEQGDALAQYNLAVMYYEGRGVAQDMEASFAWFKRSAEQGDSDAQMQLGTMYKHGIGVEADAEKSFKWYRKSALQGNYAAIDRMPDTCGVKNIEARIH